MGEGKRKRKREGRIESVKGRGKFRELERGGREGKEEARWKSVWKFV